MFKFIWLLPMRNKIGLVHLEDRFLSPLLGLRRIDFCFDFCVCVGEGFFCASPSWSVTWDMLLSGRNSHPITKGVILPDTSFSSTISLSSESKNIPPEKSKSWLGEVGKLSGPFILFSLVGSKDTKLAIESKDVQLDIDPASFMGEESVDDGV